MGLEDPVQVRIRAVDPGGDLADRLGTAGAFDSENVELDRVDSVAGVIDEATDGVVVRTSALEEPADQIREMLPDVPVVAVTESASGVADTLATGATHAVPEEALTEAPEAVADRLVDRAREQRRAVPDVLKTAELPVTVNDPETAELLDANEHFCDLLGYDRDEILSLGLEGIGVTAEGSTAEQDREVVQNAVETDDAHCVEWAVETAAGETKWLDVRGTTTEIGGERRYLTLTRDVTERKRRRRELVETERRFERVSENVDEVIFITRGLISVPESYDDDADVGIEYVSPAFEEVWGRSREALADDHETYVSAIHPDDRESYRERLREMVADARRDDTDQRYEMDFRIERPDGECRWVTARVVPVSRADADTYRWVGTIKDITERKRREREYEQIFNNVHDSIVVHDPETGEIVDVNDTFCEMMGSDRETLLELGTEGFSVASEGYTQERAEEIIDEVMDAGQKESLKWKVETEDGDHRLLEVRAKRAEIGGEPRHISINRDITERTRRQREFEQIFNGVLDPIAVFDPESVELLDANDAFLDLVNQEDIESYREEGLAEHVAADRGFTVEKAKEIHHRVAETGEPETFDWQGRTREGDRLWLEVKVVPATINGEPVNIASHRDVTERRRRERIVRALHDTTDRLQEAETRAAVCEATVDAAEVVLGLSRSTCWLSSDDGDELQPVAPTEAPREHAGGPESFEPGQPEYEVYEGQELAVTDRGEESSLSRGVFVALGEHGLLGAGDPERQSFDQVTLDAARILARHATSALDRVQRARELRESERHFRTIAERVDEIIYLADIETREVLYLSPGHEEIWGTSLDDIYDNPEAFTRAIHPDDIDGFTAAREQMFADIEAGDPADSYDFSYRIERPDGELRWIETTGYPIVDEDDRPDRYVALVEDVTERKRREQTLETFHEATRQLTAVDSRNAACRQAVRAAEEVLGFPLVSAYLYDDTTGKLTPDAVTSRLEGRDVELPAFGPGESLPWQVYVEGEAVTSPRPNTDVYGPDVPGPDIVLPLGSHGVMLVGDGTDEVGGEDVELAQILAATLEAALNHVAGERELERRNEQLRRQQRRAQRLEQLNAIIRDIEQATVEESSRTAIEEAVCDRLTDIETHDLVWIAERSVGEERLEPRATAGGKQPYLDAVSGAIGSGAGGHPATVAYRNGEPRSVDNVATDAATGEWRRTALRHGVQSVVAVPVRHGETLHGVLTVGSEQPDAFDESTRDVLAELGRSIGYAITVTEREQALESEGTTELEFALEDDGLFLVRGATTADCELELERTVRRAGGSFSTFYVVEGADPADLVELAESAASVEDAQVISRAEDDGLIEVTGTTWFGAVFTEYGAVVREADAGGGTGRLVVETPRGSDVRALVESFQERYPETELVAQRQRDRTVRSLFELRDALQDGLTDRQLEALETAYSAGYFAWPRETSGEEVADLLGVTQPTFNKHLRIAERTAFRMLLDREHPDT